MNHESERVSVRTSAICLAVAGLAVGLGGAAGVQLSEPGRQVAYFSSVSAATAVMWTLTGAWLATTMSILPLGGKARLWLPPLALLTALAELLPRSEVSLRLLCVSLLSLGLVAVAHGVRWRAAQRGIALICGASIAAILVTSSG